MVKVELIFFLRTFSHNISARLITKKLGYLPTYWLLPSSFQYLDVILCRTLRIPARGERDGQSLNEANPWRYASQLWSAYWTIRDECVYNWATGVKRFH